MPDRRQQVVLGLSAAIVAAVVAVALALGTGEEPPATGAASLVPSDALVYVHLSTDRRRPAVKRALALAGRFPDFPLFDGDVEARLAAVFNAPGSRVASWLGNEAAFALLNTTSSTAGSLIVLDVARPLRARQFVADGGAQADGAYRGTPLLRYPGGAELAFVSHYLVLGQAGSVRSAIDVASGRLAGLTASSAYQQAAGGEPAERVLDAYASVSGVRRVLSARAGAIGALGRLLDQPALSGVSVSLSAAPPGARVAVHSALDPTLAKVSTPSAAAFDPTLADVLPARGALLLEVQNLVQWAPRVLGSVATAGVAGRVQPLFRRLGAALASEGVNLNSLTSVFAGDSAFAISATVPRAVAPPGRRGRRSPAARSTVPRGPALVIVTRTKDQQATSSLLASLEGPLAQLFPPPSSGPGAAPEFSEVPLAGGAVTAHRLALAPGLELDYAVFRGLVVVSTSLPAISAMVQHTQSLSDEARYQKTLGDRPDQVTSLLFLDFSQLLNLGEQTGLIRGGRLSALLPDLEKISSVGLTSTRQESDTNAELSLNIP